MKSIKIYLMVICLLIVSTGVQAQIGSSLTKTGTTAAQFLKIGVGPRAIGMGGAFTASVNDVSAMYWNPAGLSKIQDREAFFNHVDWILDVNFDFAGFAMDISGFGTLGAFVTILSMDEMLVRTVEKPEGTGENFGAGAMAIGISYARNLTDNFAIGFNAKYIREYIWHESAISFALDAGVMYRIPFLNETRIAASVSNFGPKMKLDGRDVIMLNTFGSGEGNIINSTLEMDYFELPLLYRVGVAVDAIKTGSSKLTTEINAVHPNDHTEYINSGLEYSWNDLIFLRAGYKSLFERDTEQGLTFGAGVNYRFMEAINLKVDYAYQSFGRLKDVHYFSLGIKF